MFMFKEGLSAIIDKLSCNSNRKFFMFPGSTLKLSKDGELWQSNK